LEWMMNLLHVKLPKSIELMQKDRIELLTSLKFNKIQNQMPSMLKDYKLEN